MAFWNVRHRSLHSRDSLTVYGSVPFWIDGAGMLCQPERDPHNEVLAAVERGMFICTGQKRPVVVTDAGAEWFRNVPGAFELLPSVDPGAEAVTPASPVLRSDLLSLVNRLVDEAPTEAQRMRQDLRERFGLPFVRALAPEFEMEPDADGLIPGVPGQFGPDAPPLDAPSEPAEGPSDDPDPDPDSENPRPRRPYKRRT